MSLRAIVDAGYKEAGWLTLTEAHEKKLCVRCRNTASFYSDAGVREYSNSGLCEPCFDAMFAEEE